MRWIVALAAAAVSGCASIGAPPGGPVRTTPPEILSVAPDSGAVNVRARSVMFTFDAVVNDRADLDKLILMSPQDGPPRVSWRRERVEVRPRRGFRPNTTYSVTLLPGLGDLRGNTIKTSRTVIFSTGPSIPSYMVLGRVFDWLNERTAPRAFVEVIRRPDSLLYIGIADSSGQFGIGPLAEGTYTVRATIDNNSNRGRDPGEPWDSVGIVIGGSTSPFVELLAAPRDTIPPRLLIVSAADTLTINATFDRPLDPQLRLAPEVFRVVSADSVALRVASVMTRAQADSLRAIRDSIARDSTARARDTTSARRDTTARPDTTRRPAAGRDTSRLGVGGPITIPRARPSRPPPPREVVLRLDRATPLRAGKSYRITAVNMKGLLGAPRSSERVITVPRARPDSTRAPAATPVPTTSRPP